MGITVFCDSPDHPVLPAIKLWMLSISNETKLISNIEKLSGGQYLFLISCNQVINESIRSRFQHVLVMHASDLPQGRGWNPCVWQILEGKSEITLSLIEAEDKVDTGDIWHQLTINIDDTDIFEDINKKLSDTQIAMLDWVIIHGESVEPKKQLGDSSYYRLRNPGDSEINTASSIVDQFNLLRVCDPNRYPAFFYYKGEKFTLKIERVENHA